MFNTNQKWAVEQNLWSDQEKFLIAKLHGIISVELITVLINHVGKKIRTVKSVQDFGNGAGYKFRVVAA